jgi:hypothetical protein
MSTIYDKLPIIWQETHSKLSPNTVLQSTIIEMFENEMLEEVKPEAFSMEKLNSNLLIVVVLHLNRL